MRAVIQRVSSSSVSVDKKLLAKTQHGLVVLLGIAKEDGEKDTDYMADKIADLRIFSDREGKLNLSVRDIKGEILLVSQFTLFGDCRKGRRPSFTKAAQIQKARELYELVFIKLQKKGLLVKKGQFQSMMSLNIVNDGPITLLLDSSRIF